MATVLGVLQLCKLYDCYFMKVTLVETSLIKDLIGKYAIAIF